MILKNLLNQMGSFGLIFDPKSPIIILFYVVFKNDFLI